MDVQLVIVHQFLVMIDSLLVNLGSLYIWVWRGKPSSHAIMYTFYCKIHFSMLPLINALCAAFHAFHCLAYMSENIMIHSSFQNCAHITKLYTWCKFSCVAHFGMTWEKGKLKINKMSQWGKCLLIWSVLEAMGLLLCIYMKLWTFDSPSRAVSVEFLSECCVLLLKLLQVLRQTHNCGTESFLLPLGAFALRSATTDREGGRRERVLIIRSLAISFYSWSIICDHSYLCGTKVTT